MSELGSFRDTSSKGIQYEFKKTELRLRNATKEGVALIKFGVNARGCNGASSGKVESVSYPSKIDR